MSSNFIAVIAICSDSGAQKNKVSHCFHCFPICHEVMGSDAMILVFWMLSLKPTFSLSSFTFIQLQFLLGSLACQNTLWITDLASLCSQVRVMGWTVSHSDPCVEVLIPSTSQVGMHIEKRAFKEVVRIKWVHYGGHSNMTSVLRRRGKLDTYVHTQKKDHMRTQGEGSHLQAQEEASEDTNPVNNSTLDF